MGWDRGGNFYWLVGVLGLEAPGNNGLEARWTHWLEASVTDGGLPGGQGRCFRRGLGYWQGRHWLRVRRGPGKQGFLMEKLFLLVEKIVRFAHFVELGGAHDHDPFPVALVAALAGAGRGDGGRGVLPA